MVCFLLNQYVCHPHFNKVLGTHVNNAELQISWSFQYVYWNNRLNVKQFLFFQTFLAIISIIAQIRI